LSIFLVGDIISANVKLPGHRLGLPGKVISFHIVPLDPAGKAGLAGHVPANKCKCFVSNWEASEHDEPGVYAEQRKSMDVAVTYGRPGITTHGEWNR
jgi:hypothetical protein